ncbi:MAG TPA: O-antigen ligase family protein [Bacteroidales bacterium]|nr:O-antigen ligase family protein [Bacteroidales bacterium]
MRYKLSVFLVFLGSVFLTSEKFVDTENTIKFYFTILAALVGIIIVSFNSNNLKLELQKLTSFSILKGFYIAGVLQAIYGILQYIGKYSSNNEAFAITGSFENPAGFIAVLSFLFSIGVYWCIKSKKIEQRLIFFSLGLILYSIILTGSRTGIIAVFFSTFTILSIEFQLLLKIKKLKYYRLIICSSIATVLFILFLLYKNKEDSANGRLLIWKVSTEMIKDKPLFGFGYKGFQANYMDYQAKYFEKNPQSKFKQLADNVIHPFNEFVNIAISFGVIGLALYLLVLTFIIWMLLNFEHQHKSILVGLFITFIIISCFSYLFCYSSIWILIGYFSLVVFSKWIPYIRISLITKIAVIAFCLLGIIFFSSRIVWELKWKNILVKSLQGQTEQMLPQYEKLYPFLKHNEYFLYNYGAELNIAKQYDKSIIILKECQKFYNDYDLQMLLADNYFQIGDTINAIRIYCCAENMIPCRFLPLYCQMEIYEKNGKKNKVNEIARKIVEKEIKVKSAIVESIIEKAELNLSN